MYDLIIIGAGPAGLSAAIYAARYKLKTLVIGKEIGGMINEAHLIENYPGYFNISGMELMKKFKEHINYFKIEIKQEEVRAIKKNFQVITDKSKYQAKSLILALGTRKRKLNIEDEDKFIGRGISYCYTCDAPFFKDKTVAVVGGSNSAAMAAMLLTEYAKKVYIIYRKDKLRAEPYYVEKLTKNKKVQIIYNSNVTKLQGTKFLEKITLDNKKELDVGGLFIEIGSVPITALLNEIKVKLDKNRYIIINEKGETNVKGVFAAGDITNHELKQTLTAAAEGSIACHSAFKYLK